MIRVTHAHQLIMERRRVPCLVSLSPCSVLSAICAKDIPLQDSFFDRVKCLLWPRFKTVFDMNLVSVRKAKAARLGYDMPCSVFQLTRFSVSSATNAPTHYVTRRYAEFAASILALHQASVGEPTAGSSEGTGDEMLLNNL